MVKRTVRRRLRGGDDPVAPAAPAAPGGILGFLEGVKNKVVNLNPFRKADAPATETSATAPASGSDGVPAGQQAGRRRKTTRLSRRQRRTRRHARRH